MKYAWVAVILSAPIMCFLSGCSGPESKEPEMPDFVKLLSLPPSDFSCKGGDCSVLISTNLKWTADVAAGASSWLSVAPSSGTPGSSEISICVKPNFTYQSRAGDVVIKAGTASTTLHIKQEQYVELSVRPNSIYVSPEGGDVEVTVKSTGEYSAETSADWIHLPMTKAEQTETLTIKVDAQVHAEERVATVTFRLGSLTETLVVRQPGKYILSIDEKELRVSGKKGEFKVKVNCNTEFSVSSDSDWVSMSIDEDSEGNYALIKVDSNPFGKERSCTIVFKAGDCTETLKLTQEADKSADGSIDDMPIEEM